MERKKDSTDGGQNNRIAVIMSAISIVIALLVFLFGEGILRPDGMAQGNTSPPGGSDSSETSKPPETNPLSVTNDPLETNIPPVTNDPLETNTPHETSEPPPASEPQDIISKLVFVPNVVGMEQIEATELLANRGLQFQVWWTEENNISSEHYYVIDQSIPAESSVLAGTLVELELSPKKEVASELVFVPNVIGMEQIEATELLTNQGLQFQVWWTEENNIAAEQYYIIDQSIPAYSNVVAGTLIELELSPRRP